jgi:F-type H+-transporting ATPase subunit delta
MKNEVLTKRYTQGLINSVKDEAEYSALSREISDFSELLESRKELKDVLSSPLLPSSKKKQIAEEILIKKSVAEKTLRFILLVVENMRFELLPEIVESMPEAWNEKKGISTFEVASVVPLSDKQKKKLQEKLTKLEKRQVSLKYRIDPELIAGLWIRKGNIVYDVSLKGSLVSLKDKIIEG